MSIRSIAGSFWRYVDFLQQAVSAMLSYTTDCIKSLPESYKSYRYKLNHLASTNVNLLYFHFRNGNYSDVIFRSRVIRVFFPNSYKIEFDYYVGVSYIQMNKTYKSVRYFNDYLAHMKRHKANSSNFIEETKYFLDIAHYALYKISFIPKRVVVDAFTIDAGKPLDLEYKSKQTGYGASHDPESDGMVWQTHQGVFVDFIMQGMSRHYPIGITRSCRTLDIGCGKGMIGYILRDKGYKGDLHGADITKAALTKASTLLHNNSPVYDVLMHTDFLNDHGNSSGNGGDNGDGDTHQNYLIPSAWATTAATGHDNSNNNGNNNEYVEEYQYNPYCSTELLNEVQYNIIILDDLISYYPDLSEVLRAIEPFMSDECVVAISYTVSIAKTDRYVLDYIDKKFHFSKDFIYKELSKNKHFKILSEYTLRRSRRLHFILIGKR